MKKLLFTLTLFLIALSLYGCRKVSHGGAVVEDHKSGYSYVCDGLICVSKKFSDGSVKYGYINEQGKEIIDCKYYMAEAFINGHAVVSEVIDKQSSENGISKRIIKYLIDTKGQKVSKDYDEIELVNYNGLVFYYCRDSYRETGFRFFCLVDETGNEIYARKYSGRSLMRVKYDESRNLICCYDVNRSNNMLASVEDNYVYINIRGEVVVSSTHPQADISKNTGLFTTYDNDKYGYVNAKDELVVDYIYDIANNFNDNDFAVVVKDNKYAAISLEGSVVIDFGLYENISIQNNYFIVIKDGKYGLLDNSLKTILDFSYDDIKVCGNYFKVKRLDKYGLIDLNGKFIFEPEYDYIDECIKDTYYANKKENDSPVLFVVKSNDGRTILQMENINAGYDKNTELFVSTLSDRTKITFGLDGKKEIIPPLNERIVRFQLYYGIKTTINEKERITNTIFYDNDREEIFILEGRYGLYSICNDPNNNITYFTMVHDEKYVSFKYEDGKLEKLNIDAEIKEVLSNGFFIVSNTIDHNYYLLNNNYDIVNQVKVYPFTFVTTGTYVSTEECLIYISDNKCGLIDINGKIIINAEYENIVIRSINNDYLYQ